MLKIEEFADMKQFESIMKNWAEATGLATVAVGLDGEYISDCYNFTDFCIKLTRGSEEGCKRCVKCDQEGKGVYHCHAGLIDFGMDLMIGDEKVGSVIGGQVLPEAPDEEHFRKVAREIKVDEEEYIEALHKVSIKSEQSIHASAELLGQVLNNFINAEYERMHNQTMVDTLEDGVNETFELVDEIVKSTEELKAIQRRQAILSLNANIEAARAGDHGRGFSVVAIEVGKLAQNSSVVNTQIEKVVRRIAEVVGKMKKAENNID